jgi:NADPH:quinone reductase-like Zn-dependent oxidoreductase
MKAIRLHTRGGPEAFVYEEAPQPHPEEGEVLVRVHAAAVTPTELAWGPTWTTPTGKPRQFPIILGHEFSGEVVAIGSGVTDVAAGDLVYGLNDWFHDGAQAEYCVARATEVAWKPRSVDHVWAAVTPISALTAWQGLIERGRDLCCAPHQSRSGRDAGGSRLDLSPDLLRGPPAVLGEPRGAVRLVHTRHVSRTGSTVMAHRRRGRLCT